MEKYNWTTEHDTVKNVIKHTFPGDRITVEVAMNQGMAYTKRDGELFRSWDINTISVNQYLRFLLQTAKEAEMLKPFNQED
jgi:hypothetical protein